MSEHPQNSFTFLRLAAAFMVWYGYCSALGGGRETLGFDTAGGLGIAIFFIISGYFTTQSYERINSVLPFAKNRILRVFPALALCVVVTAYIVGPLATTLPLGTYLSHPETTRYLRTMIAYPLQYELPGVFQKHSLHAVNASLWTLPSLAHCYGLIAVLGMVGILQPRIIFAVFAGLAALLAYQAYSAAKMPGSLSEIRLTSFRFVLHLNFLFAGGALIYMWRQSLPRHLGLLAASVLVMLFSRKLDVVFGTLLFDAALLYTVIYIGFLRIPVLSQFGRFGDFSYGIYLYAFPMSQLALCFVKPGTMFLAASFALTLLSAVISWHVIEKWPLKYKS